MATAENVNSEWLGLAGRRCVVTGGASGIGKAVGTALARAGARVALLDRNAEGCAAVAGEITAAGGSAMAVGCDTSNEQAVKDAAARVEDAFGGCDVLVNNAGLLRSGGLDTLSRADWNMVLSVNLDGYFLCAQAFGKSMLRDGRGSIVHIASIAAQNPQPRSGSYSPAKAGVVALAKQLAVEWGPRGVRSNAISPGMIRTPLSEDFYTKPGVLEKRSAVVPSGRVGTPVDIAEVALFLASDRAGYVNGVELLVDGGYECMIMELVPRPGF